MDQTLLDKRLKTIANRIRLLREKCDNFKTQAEFAKLTGIELSTLKKYENGQVKSIPVEALIKIKTAIQQNFFCVGNLWEYLLGEAPCDNFKYISIDGIQIDFENQVPPKQSINIDFNKILSNEDFIAYWKKFPNKPISSNNLKDKIKDQKAIFLQAVTDFADSDYFAWAICCQIDPDKARKITKGGEMKYVVNYNS